MAEHPPSVRHCLRDTMAAAVAVMRNKERRERDKNDEAKMTLKAAALGETAPRPLPRRPLTARLPLDLRCRVYRGAEGWAGPQRPWP